MLVDDEGSVLTLLGRISGSIDRLGSLDSAVLPIRERLGEAVEILKDLSGELRHY
ncbi:hypothetical protein B1A_01870, partial [mine drainage metagenome]